MKSDAPMDRLLRKSLELPSTPDGACLDPETAAAWADHALPSGDRAAVEAHAAQCARCQSLLAAMVKSADVTPAESPARANALRWLVPLAAGVAAVALWIWVPGTQPSRPTSTTAADTPASPPAAAAQAGDATPPPVAPPSAAPMARAESRQGFRAQPASPAAPPPASAERRDAADARKQAAPATANEAPLAAAAPRERAAASADAKVELADKPAALVTSPDPEVVWRILAGGIQRSIDSGRTWNPQTTGIDGLIDAGAAPAASVCWAVGRQGAVARWTEASGWQRIPFPDSSLGLVSIQALDDRTAIVTASDGRRFRTTDGGATWSLRAPQEFFAAPF
jgi:hypothetical protein